MRVGVTEIVAGKSKRGREREREREGKKDLTAVSGLVTQEV